MLFRALLWLNSKYCCRRRGSHARHRRHSNHSRTQFGVNNADKKRLANQLVGQQNKGRITMKRFTMAFSVAALIASLASARAGDVSVVQNSQGKMPVVIKNDAFSLAPVPAMGEGKPNQGFSYGTAFEMPGSALQIARGHVE